MTPKFRPFAFRRLLIAAGVSLALSAPTSKAASVLFWSGSGNDGASNGFLDNTNTWSDFSLSAPSVKRQKNLTVGGNATSISTSFNNAEAKFTDNSAIVFTQFASGVTVTVSANPLLGANTYTQGTYLATVDTTADIIITRNVDYYSTVPLSSGLYASTTPFPAATTDFAPITLESGASVTLAGGPVYGTASSSTSSATFGTFLNVKSGASLTLQSANFFSGKTNISGSLTISNGAALGQVGGTNATVVNNGGSLRLIGGITTSAEDLILTGSSAMVNLSGNNIYSGVVTLAGTVAQGTTISVTGGSLKFTKAVNDTYTNAGTYFNIDPGASSSSVTFSGGVNLSSNASLYISSFSGSGQAAGSYGSVTIDTAPLVLTSGNSLKVGGGATLNLNTEIIGGTGSTNAAGTLIIGDIYGAGGLSVGSSNALNYIKALYIFDGSVVAAAINQAADISVAAAGSLNLTGSNITLTGSVVNQNTNPSALNFSSTTGTVTLTSGFSNIGNPWVGSTHFGASAIISGYGIQGGSTVVDKNLTVASVSGSIDPTNPITSVTVGGQMTCAGSISGGSTVVSVTGDAAIASVSAGTVTIGGKLSGIGLAGTDISGGTVTITGTGSLINTLSSTSATLKLNGANTTITNYSAGVVVLSNTSQLTSGGGILSGQFSGTGVTITNNTSNISISGALNLGTTAANFGTTATISSLVGGTGVFAYSSSIATMSGGSVSIATGRKLAIGGQSAAAVISGLGGVDFGTSAGTYTISGNNTYSGGTAITSGQAVVIGSDSALGAGGTVAIAAGSLYSSGTSARLLANPFSVTGTFSLGSSSTANSGQLNFSGPINFNNGTSANIVLNNSDVVFSGVISGVTSGNFNKIGLGKLTVSGSSILNGGTVSAGTLVGSTTNLTGNYALTNGANLEFSHSSTTAGTFTGVISGGGAATSLIKSGAGTVVLSGTSANTYNGTTKVLGGTLSGNTTRIRGNIETYTNGILEFNEGGTSPVTFAGTFNGDGTGTLWKSGTGALTLSGIINATNIVVNAGRLQTGGTIVGNVAVNSGTLNIGTSPAGGITGAVTVGASGTLEGSGTIIGNVTVNGGTVNLGNSPAIVTAYGNHTQNSGTFISEIGGTTPGNTLPGFHDQYNVIGGAFTITGAVKLQLNSWYASGTTPFVPSRGDSFNIINATNGILGEFNSVDNNVDSQQVLIFAQHTGTVYALGRDSGTSPKKFGDAWVGTAPANATQYTIYNAIYDSAVTSGNSTTPSKFIDGTSAEGRLAIAIIKDTSGTAFKTNDFSAESYFGVTDYALTVTRSVTDAALNQPVFYKQKRWAVGADYNYVSNKFNGGTSADIDRSLTGQTGFFTATYDLSDDATVGVFAGFNSGSTSTNNTRFDYDGTLMGLTGRLRFNTRYPFSLKAALVNTDLSFDSQRTMLGVSNAASLTNQKLKETSLAIQADVEAMRIDRWMILANFGLSYGSASTDAFTENGSVVGLKVDGLSQKSTQASVGVSTRYYRNLKLSYNLSAKLEKDFGSSGSLSSRFSGSTGPMTALSNPSSGQTALAIGAGLNYKPSASTLFSAGAEVRGSSDYSGDVRLNLSYKKKF